MRAPAAPLCFQYTRRRLHWTIGTTRLVCLPIRLVRGNASIPTTVSFPYTEATSPARRHLPSSHHLMHPSFLLLLLWRKSQKSASTASYAGFSSS
ncbi:hypothetical protein C0989_011103, partial [Termitomyces sp. Mn162]